MELRPETRVVTQIERTARGPGQAADGCSIARPRRDLERAADGADPVARMLMIPIPPV
jgi:hypothetical protein